MSDEDDRPTMPAWVLSAVADLEKQIDRLLTGRGCKQCRASGHEVRAGYGGEYERVCPSCDGRGLV